MVHWVTKVVKKVVGATEEIITDSSCSLFATVGLPGYFAVATLLGIENSFQIPKSTTADQDFFIFPLHGNISHDNGIRIFYNAKLPPGFGDTSGVTIGRNIYVRSGVNTTIASDAGFPNATSILLHEFTHSTKQYQAHGYDLASFAGQHLFNFCKVSPGDPYPRALL